MTEMNRIFVKCVRQCPQNNVNLLQKLLSRFVGLHEIIAARLHSLSSWNRHISRSALASSFWRPRPCPPVGAQMALAARRATKSSLSPPDSNGSYH